MFWNIDELKQMHIELTNACNAACPMCVRFHRNSPLTRPDLEIGQITLDKFKEYFPPDIIRRCDLILFCGVHGDPCVAKDVLEICQYIDEVSKTTAIRMNTNGGMRRSPWWSELGKLFAKHTRNNGNSAYWKITFSIDGLEDTNHLYRRNVNWNILMENVKAFINEGALAAWDFLIFKHNEHQLKEAATLSKELGFEEFVPKKALGVDNNDKLRSLPVLDANGQLDYWIEPPLNAKNRNLEKPKGYEPLQFYPFTIEEYRADKASRSRPQHYKQMVDNVYETISSQEFVREDSSEISCKSKTGFGGKEIFVDNFGRVLPCCYVGTHLNGVYNDVATLQLHKHMNDYGWEHFSLENHSLEEIFASGHLDKVFADSWTKESIKCGKLKYCADTCGRTSGVDKIFTHDLNNISERNKQASQRTTCK